MRQGGLVHRRPETRGRRRARIKDGVGVTRPVLYKWKNRLLGAPCKMKDGPRGMADDADALRSQVAELELRKTILEGTVELLGKDQSVDPGMLTNRKKTLVANSLRPAHRLNEILSRLGMSSSYQYQVEAMRGPDKYSELGKSMAEIFAVSGGRYGYHQIRLDLTSEGVRVLEKVVARLIRKLDLVAKHRKRRRYNSFQRRDIRCSGEPGKAQLPCRCAQQAVAHRHHGVQDARRQGLSQPHRGLLRQNGHQLGRVDLPERRARERHA